MDDIDTDTHSKGFLSLDNKQQAKQARDNTLDRKVPEHTSTLIKSSIAVPVAAMPNYPPTINNGTNVTNVAKSTLAQKLVEYQRANSSSLLTDNTSNNKSFIVSMRPSLYEIRNFYANFWDYDKTRIHAIKTTLTKEIDELTKINDEMIKKD